MNPPSISVSMSDAANTRENEGPCICDGCLNECHCDGSITASCNEALEGEIADQQYEARRDEE